MEIDEISQQKQVEKLSSYIPNKFNMEKKITYQLITNILSEVFIDIYNKTSNESLSKINILNVGVGSGKNIKKLISPSNIIQDRAENLTVLKANSYDLYVSLRTYNSSFFDVKRALKEAYRVLKDNINIKWIFRFKRKKNNPWYNYSKFKLC